MLREQGAAALKAQLADTIAFVELLFVRERDAEPLDTPERRAGLKQRLRKAAAAIADPDLAEAYREELQRRFDALFPAAPRAGAGRLPRRGGAARGFRGPDPRLTDAGRAGAQRLARASSRWPRRWPATRSPTPPCWSRTWTSCERHGFGDPALADLVSEIIRLRLDAEHLDTEALQRHLASRGFSALLNDIDRAAAKSGAPFIQSDVTLAVARSQWSHAFAALNRLAALEDAMDPAKAGAWPPAPALPRLIALKTERDSLRRAIKTGTIWSEDGSN